MICNTQHLRHSQRIGTPLLYMRISDPGQKPRNITLSEIRLLNVSEVAHYFHQAPDNIPQAAVVSRKWPR